MSYAIRPALEEDVPFLWKMLAYAAHLDEDGPAAPLVSEDPFLQRYVHGWGRPTDLGFVAVDPSTGKAVGAAWVRLLIGAEQTPSYVDEQTPELALAVHPAYRGHGVGTQLLQHLLVTARQRFPAVVLSVRATNPARHLYERLGFVVIGTIVNRVGSSSDTMLRTFHEPS